MHGIGRYTWSDNKQYEGQYLHDKKHGYGVYIWPDGRVYRGYWKDGKQHGLAEYSVVVEKVSENEVRSQVRYGLWKDGRRQRWFKVRNSEE
jgi:hypothetical protein